MKEFFAKYDNKTLRKGAIALLIYFLWVIWLGNYWFILGLPIVFDMYITKKVNWTPWKKREGKNHIIIEWFDALIFAVVAVTIINIFLFQNYKIPTGSMEKSLQIGDHLYVSKVAYGPRIPNTPLALPFMQHTIPGSTKKSYLDWPNWDYKRLKGFTKVKRWDPVVFNFPAGDTVCLEMQNVSYYSIVRDQIYRLKKIDIESKKPLKSDDEYYSAARQLVWNNFEIVVRPVDKRDNYIKRCVAIPGDSLLLKNGVLFINGEMEQDIEGRQLAYNIITNGKRLNKKSLNKLGIYSDDLAQYENGVYVHVPMTSEMVETVKAYKNVVDVVQFDYSSQPSHNIFPHNDAYNWSVDNFGPIYIPQAGATVELNMESLPFYKRIIGYHEGNKLEVKDSVIYINDEVATSYTFEMDYYWMMGDNRNSSLDARYWGYVPEDHIIGRPRFIWLSMHKEKSFPANIQFKRMFKVIR